MKFYTKHWHEGLATVARGAHPDGSTKLTVKDRYGSVICDATICLRDLGELPANGNVFIPDWGDNEGVLRALQYGGVIGRTKRTIETAVGTRDPLTRRAVHECQLLEEAGE